MTKEQLSDFIGLFKDYKQQQQNQKMRGLNDFNLFTVLLKTGDEVRLHSRFLQFLLDPKGQHYQGDLFLRLFLNACDLSDSDFPLDTKNCSVYNEHQNIDLYISDGNRHIIIENKIWAGDQPGQIKRYIDIIKKTNQRIDFNDLVVIYLSLDRKQPSDYSLYNDQHKKQDGFCVEDGYLIAVKDGNKTDEKYRFRSIYYKKQIKRWLERSHQEIANITNLSVGIIQYQDVIDMLYNQYKGKVMNINEYLNGKENKKESIQTMKEISAEYSKFRECTIKQFTENSEIKLRKKIEAIDNWNLTVDERFHSGKKWGFALTIAQSNRTNILFCFNYEGNNFYRPTWGIGKTNDAIDLNTLRIDPTIQKLLENVHLSKEHSWWLRYGYYYDGDLFDNIIDNFGGDTDKAAIRFVEGFMEMFEKYENVVIKCNEILNKNQQQGNEKV